MEDETRNWLVSHYDFLKFSFPLYLSFSLSLPSPPLFLYRCLHQLVNTNWLLTECKCMLCNDFNELCIKMQHVFMLNRTLKADKNFAKFALSMSAQMNFDVKN